MKFGLEVLAHEPNRLKDYGRLVLLSNQASVDRHFNPAWAVIRELASESLVALMGPQHGFESTVQDNMIETGHALHKPTGLPVFSLYSETREPTAEMLAEVDTVVIDLQISGTRIYTYKYTIAACLRAAKKYGKRVLILDRPNPLGGVVVEGRVLEPSARSFVGEYPIPMRHGMTAAEAACFFNRDIGAELDILWMQGWQPNMMWNELNRPWILTSPNLATAESAYVYPGMVIFEGTNISEGRGTARPFQLIGAPGIRDAREFKRRVIQLLGYEPVGLYLRPTSFQPTYHKWSNEECQGLDVIVRDPQKIRSYSLGLAMLRAGIELMEGDYHWAQPPYEYNEKDLPIDLILGSLSAHERFTASEFDLSDPFWSQGISEYIESVADLLHYPREMRF